MVDVVQCSVVQSHQIEVPVQTWSQSGEQWSKLLLLPSSHTSPASTMPLPHTPGGSGQLVTTPLQFKVVAVTLHGCEQVNTWPLGQSSSHPVRAWLVWLSPAVRTSPQPATDTSNVATSTVHSFPIVMMAAPRQSRSTWLAE